MSAPLLGAVLLLASTLPAHAADARFYDPRNAASSTGFTFGYELFRTIGCPGRGLLDTPCPVDKSADPVAKATDTHGDGDGVADPIERCPTVFAKTADGCPEAAAPKPAALAPAATVPPVSSPAEPAAAQSDPVGQISPAADYTVTQAVGPFDISRRLVLEGVNFDFDKATLRQEDRDVIDKNAATLKAWGDIKVEVSGHTDNVGTDRYNMRLSLRRAHAVRDYLVSQGISAGRLIARGYGESQPVASHDADEGRFQNRRVELNQFNENPRRD